MTGPAIAELGRGETRVISFDELGIGSSALADGLRRVGVRPGHRVALLVPPGLDLTTTVYACWQAGAVIVVADAGLGWRRMADSLRSADPDYLIGIPAAVAAAAAVKLPGIRVVAGELPRPIRQLLGIQHSIDELVTAGDGGALDATRQVRLAPWQLRRVRQRCCSPPAPLARRREWSIGITSCWRSWTSYAPSATSIPAID